MNLVRKPFIVEGIQRIQGEIVSVGRERNQKVLLEQRYIVDYNGKTCKCSKCNRIFDTAQTLKLHTDTLHLEDTILKTQEVSIDE